MTKHRNNPDALVSLRDVERMTGLPRDYLLAAFKTGMIPQAYGPGGKMRIALRDIGALQAHWANRWGAAK